MLIPNMVYRILAKPAYTKAKFNVLTVISGIAIVILYKYGVANIRSNEFLSYAAFLVLGFTIISYVYFYSRMHNFTYIGTITFRSTGISITQLKGENYQLDFENIYRIYYDIDRHERDILAKHPPVKTYKLTVILNTNERQYLYVEKVPLEDKENLNNELPVILEEFRKTNHTMYKMIRNSEVYD